MLLEDLILQLKRDRMGLFFNHLPTGHLDPLPNQANVQLSSDNYSCNTTHMKFIIFIFYYIFSTQTDIYFGGI